MKQITLRDLLLCPPGMVPKPKEYKSTRVVIERDPAKIAEVLVRACYNANWSKK